MQLFQGLPTFPLHLSAQLFLAAGGFVVFCCASAGPTDTAALATERTNAAVIVSTNVFIVFLQ
jgi:hypothetical protein